MKGRRRRRGPDAGFTMLEVLMALLVAMVGLMGTLAVQQTVLGATAMTNDAQVALRLATGVLEEFKTRRTQGGTTIVDMLRPIAAGTWTPPVYLDAEGNRSAANSSTNRWALQTRVVDLGVGRPYNISVQVTYALDNGAAKVVRLDAERRKTW